MIEIDTISFTVITLAVWRITHLIQAEDGPFDIIFKIRKMMADGVIGKLMDCFYCLSIWVALIPGLYFGRGWVQKIFLWLAISGAAIILEKLTNKADNNSQLK